MRLKLSLARPTGVIDDIVITTDATATVGEVADTLLRTDPLAPDLSPDRATTGWTLRASEPGSPASKVLSRLTPIGESKIGSGASVTVVSSRGASLVAASRTAASDVSGAQVPFFVR